MELGEARSTRIAYHQGKIEFMTPLWEHENRNWQIGRLIILLIEELNLEYELGGSVTLKRPERAAGKELDLCYYIQNAALVRGNTELDLTSLPPPDLAVEVDITNSPLNQLDLYADIGVPEVWR